MLKLGLGRKRGMFYPPAKPIINPLSPQAQGLMALLHSYGLTGGIAAQTPKQTMHELVSGRWLDTDTATTYQNTLQQNYILGPSLGVTSPNEGSSNLQGIFLQDAMWKIDKVSLTVWHQASSSINSTYQIASLGHTMYGGQGLAIAHYQNGNSYYGRYIGNISDANTGYYNGTERTDPHLFVATFDEADLMRFYVDGSLRQTIAMDHATYGPADGASPSFYSRMNTQGNTWEARYYNRVLQPDEIWQMWSPETRWDLYRQHDAPAYIDGATLFPFTDDFTGSNDDEWSRSLWVTSIL